MQEAHIYFPFETNAMHALQIGWLRIGTCLATVRHSWLYVGARTSGTLFLHIFKNARRNRFSLLFSESAYIKLSISIEVFTKFIFVTLDKATRLLRRPYGATNGDIYLILQWDIFLFALNLGVYLLPIYKFI